MGNFRYALNDYAVLPSGEGGTIIGRAEYSGGENQYQLRYVAGDGRMVESWWAESAFTGEAPKAY